MMTKKEFNQIVKCCGLNNTNLYDNFYKKSISEFNLYFDAAIKALDKKNLIVLFLESGPDPLRNYIFKNMNCKIQYATDKFLWNTCVGFDIDPKNLTKGECLKELYSREKWPVLIIDLFPFHGINLSEPKRNPIRRDIYENFKANNELLILALKDPIDYLEKVKGKKVFLFGVPGTFWNSFGGPGKGSIFFSKGKKISAPLGSYLNKTNIVNVGGQAISSNAIKIWRNAENV